MTASSDQGEAADFFISYTAVDRPWAEWIAWQLESARYTVVLQAWDFVPGRDFLHEMEKATSSRRTIAVLSNKYRTSAFSEAEWRAAFAKDPTGERGLLVPVMVTLCTLPSLLASRVYINLTDKAEHEARVALLEGVSGKGARPAAAPAFPRELTSPPMFPGDLGERHEPLRSRPGKHMEFPHGRTAIYFSADPISGAAFAADRYHTIRELLDDLYVTYLSSLFPPFSYGESWILAAGAGGTGRVGRCLVPLDWLSAVGLPIREVAGDWQNLTPAEVGLHIDRGFHVLRDPERYGYYGVICDDGRVMEVLERHTKARYMLEDKPGQLLSPSEAVRLGQYWAVFRCEFRLFSGKVVDLRGDSGNRIVRMFS